MYCLRETKPHPAWGPSGQSCPAERAERPPSLSPTPTLCLGGTMAQARTCQPRPRPQTVPAWLPIAVRCGQAHSAHILEAGHLRLPLRPSTYWTSGSERTAVPATLDTFADRDQSEAAAPRASNWRPGDPAPERSALAKLHTKEGERAHLQDTHGWKSGCARWRSWSRDRAAAGQARLEKRAHRRHGRALLHRHRQPAVQRSPPATRPCARLCGDRGC